MKILQVAALAAGLAMTGAAAQAAVINIAAVQGTSAAAIAAGNAAGLGGQGFSDFVNVTLSAGTYAFQEVGLAGGGLYDAWTIYQPAGNNGAYSGLYTYVINGVKSDVFAGANYNNAAASLAAYANLNTTVTLASTTTVSFYISDQSYPYFSDDSGGVSINIKNVPEPASLALLAAGMIGLVATRRKAAPPRTAA